jgi:hypothetical protein
MPPPATSSPSSFRSLWVTWWHQLSPTRRWGPLAGVAIFLLLHLGLGGFRPDHVLLAAAVLAVGYGGPMAAPWFRLLLPVVLMAVVYDGQGYVRSVLHGHLTIHVSQPADWDRALFGITTADGILTPPEWWQRHTHPALDVFCGAIYLSFIPTFIGVALWMRRPGADLGHRAHTAESMTWAFFWLGLISCLTYYLYPAAPPWYLADYGPGAAVLDAAPSAAGAARADALLGTTIFEQFYARSPNVFGAIPSLHVAIPLLAFIFNWRDCKLCWRLGAYTAVMAFSAVYLNHHYIVDLLWGAAYALGSTAAVTRWRQESATATTAKPAA